MHFLHQLSLFTVCLATLFAASLSDSKNFYDEKNGPSTWANSIKRFCAGVKQSPIDLSFQQSVEDEQVKKFQFASNLSTDSKSFSLLVSNNGHALKLSWSLSELNIRMGLDEKKNYKAVQLHWHWGSDSSHGSEHTLDKKTYAAEGHLVFFNEANYDNFSSAADKPNGLAVVGVFYELSNDENKLIKKLEPALANITSAYTGTALNFSREDTNLLSLFLPSNTDDFFRYEGSLTSPPCYESVLWTVFKQAEPISLRQLVLLRSLRFSDSTAMVNNFRPPLPLNPIENRPAIPRTLYRSFKIPSPTTTKPTTCISSTLSKLAPAALATLAVLARLVPALGHC